MPKNQEFNYIRALITRPEPFAQELANEVRACGGYAYTLPMIQIHALTYDLNACMQTQLKNLSQVIVTSRFAAKFSSKLIHASPKIKEENITWYALGQGTANELGRYNIQAKNPKFGITSESLLKFINLDHTFNETILILKGKGGRAHLYQQLKSLGANIHCLDTYQRIPIKYPPNLIVNALESNQINVIVCNSLETIHQLTKYLPKPQRPKRFLIVPSERLVKESQVLGFKKIYCSKSASHPDILNSLKNLLSKKL